MPPIDTSALAAIFAWVWEQYGKTIVDKAGKAVWERLRWEDRALAYGQKVQRLYGTMQILGQAKPVPLEGIFTAISLLDKPTAWRRYTVAQMEEEFAGHGQRYFYSGREANRRDGLAMVRGGENLFILGKPGAGKTTFLKYLALKGVSGELGCVPIFIGLKQLADSNLSVFDFVVREFDVCDFPDATAYLDRLLKSGKAILLFDGLDEVNVADEERTRLIDEVEDFTRKYDQCQRLITCRLAANEYGFQNYTYVEMADFNEDQISEFVVKWFTGDAKQEERRDLFLSELQKSESKGLRELARVPLLLALLCLGFEETLKLSSRRVELYEEALDALLKKWDSSRNIKRGEAYRELSLKRKEQMLAQVAAETFDRAEYFIPKRTLARSFEDFLSRVPNLPIEVDGEAVLQTITAQHGLFMERAHSIYSFAHLTFQEYFTARYVVENEARGTLHSLINRYDQQRFHEVFLLTASQLSDAREFFELFLHHLIEDVQRVPEVVEFLHHLAFRANSFSANAQDKSFLRCAYAFLLLDLDRAPALTIDAARGSSFDLALALSHYEVSLSNLGQIPKLQLRLTRASALSVAANLDVAMVIARGDYYRAIDHDFPQDVDKELEKAFKRCLNRARDLASFGASGHYDLFIRDIALVESRKSMFVAIEFTGEQRKGWCKVSEILLSVASAQTESPDEKDMIHDLVNLVMQFVAQPNTLNRISMAELDDGFSAVIERVGLVFPIKDGAERRALSTFLRGNWLLLECLAQAVVANRTALEERLL